MELRQLEHFIAVAEERSFGRAAERVHIVQSGISSSVRALERELGTQLFLRTTRRVELSEAGRALLPEARAALAATRRGREAVSAVEGVLRGTLSIGIMQVLTPIDLPGLLRAFRTAHPGVELLLRQAGAAALVDEVRAGRLDLAFTALSRELPAGVDLRALSDEPMVLALPPEHRLASRRRVQLEEIADESFVDFPQSWAVRAAADEAFAAIGANRRIAYELNDVRTAVELVAAGLGIAIVPPWVARFALPVELVGLGRGAPRWSLYVVMREHERTSPAGAALLAMLEQAS